MNPLFNSVDPRSVEEMLVGYWHYLRSIDEEGRRALGPVTLVLLGQGAIRGWPVALKNQMVALATEPELTAKSALTFVDVKNVLAASFSEVHRILPYVTSGAVSRSPLEQKPNVATAHKDLMTACETLRLELPARIFFDEDPAKLGIDEILNLIEALQSLTWAVQNLRRSRNVDAELTDVQGLHVVNSTESHDVALTLTDAGELELSFCFSRALPLDLDDRLSSMVTGLF